MTNYSRANRLHETSGLSTMHPEDRVAEIMRDAAEEKRIRDEAQRVANAYSDAQPTTVLNAYELPNAEQPPANDSGATRGEHGGYHVPHNR